MKPTSVNLADLDPNARRHAIWNRARHAAAERLRELRRERRKQRRAGKVIRDHRHKKSGGPV
jgi:hypothetical protein